MIFLPLFQVSPLIDNGHVKWPAKACGHSKDCEKRARGAGWSSKHPFPGMPWGCSGVPGREDEF